MKKKLESTFLNMVLVLFGVALISSFSLGLVFNATKDKIAAAKEAKKLKAIAAVLLKGYDNFPSKEAFYIPSDSDRELEVYPAKSVEQLQSVAIKTFTKKAFSGEMILMVGFLPDGSINKVSVVEQKETPGLGTKVTSPKYLKQYMGKNPETFNLKVKKDGGEVDAITAATISSRAFSEAVQRAYDSYKKYKNN